jgi:hypothetical protein
MNPKPHNNGHPPTQRDTDTFFIDPTLVTLETDFGPEVGIYFYHSVCEKNFFLLTERASFTEVLNDMMDHMGECDGPNV